MKNFKNMIVLLCSLIITTSFSQDTIFFNDIALRSYYIKRLAQSAYYLSLLDKQHYRYRPCNTIKQKEFIQIDSILFSHYKINGCISTMLFSASIKPLLLLLKEIKQYRYIHDQQLIYELSLLIFTVHKQILFHECEVNEYFFKTITLNDIIILSEKINQLPIAEVLNAIDMLVTELPPFFEKYELYSKITWKVWLKKYWWVPPIFGIWFGLKILLRLQRYNFYFSPYSIPKPPINLPPLITTDPALLELRNNSKNRPLMND